MKISKTVGFTDRFLLMLKRKAADAFATSLLPYSIGAFLSKGEAESKY